ncbi:hypothetical protein D3C84_1310200 [compost metagenome]
MTAIEQAVEILLDVTLAATNGFGVAQQEENAGAWLELAAGDGLDQAVQEFDGRGFIAVHTG